MSDNSFHARAAESPAKLFTATNVSPVNRANLARDQLVIGGGPYAEFETNRPDIEGNLLRVIGLAPHFADRLRSGHHEERLPAWQRILAAAAGSRAELAQARDRSWWEKRGWLALDGP